MSKERGVIFNKNCFLMDIDLEKKAIIRMPPIFAPSPLDCAMAKGWGLPTTPTRPTPVSLYVT